MKLFIFHYDNEVDFKETFWAAANDEFDARVQLAGKDEFGTRHLGRSYKLVATFLLADRQTTSNPKETPFYEGMRALIRCGWEPHSFRHNDYLPAVVAERVGENRWFVKWDNGKSAVHSRENFIVK